MKLQFRKEDIPIDYPRRYVLDYLFQIIPPILHEKVRTDLAQRMGVGARQFQNYRYAKPGQRPHMDEDRKRAIADYLGIEVSDIELPKNTPLPAV